VFLQCTVLKTNSFIEDISASLRTGGPRPFLTRQDFFIFRPLSVFDLDFGPLAKRVGNPWLGY
jgi:hypothetical protein